LYVEDTRKDNRSRFALDIDGQYGNGNR
ncbi:hypothetical protein LCGC14_2160900, partial [marine sediment metagenome]